MSATHGLCIQNASCAVFDKLCPDCYKCGFYKLEADRRKSIRLTYCDDGFYRKIIKRDEMKGEEHADQK